MPKLPKFRPSPIGIDLMPIIKFLKLQASGGIVLMATALIALVWANSAWADSYNHLWEKEVAITVGGHGLSMHLLHWINDALMAIFFFVVGLEIKREIRVGELSTMSKASLPIMAALGGMLVPAFIYILINMNGEGMRGWGIPMATDIAFALGVLALLGKRVPLSLKIFLTALAIIDDIGAVLVIAMFYTAELHTGGLVAMAVITLILFAMNRIGVRNPIGYLIPAVCLWFAVHESGLHATIAGVIVAFMVPARAVIDSKIFLDSSRELLDDFEKLGVSDKVEVATEKQLGVIHSLHMYMEYLESPLQRLEHAHHYAVTFLIVPIFALANAGVVIDLRADFLTHGITLGVFLGLLVGKQLGIFLFSWLAVRFGISKKPDDVSWLQIYGVGWLAGIGFTMSLFVTGLAFEDPLFIKMSKVGILFASLLAGLIGYLILYYTLKKQKEASP